MDKLLLQSAPGVQTQVWFANQGPKLAVFHHGVPKPRALTTEELAAFAEFGFSVACPVRGGYLESTAHQPEPMAADSATTANVVSQLGFETFLTFGFSGGGPRALADLALNPAATGGACFGSVAAAKLDFDYYGSFPPEEVEMFQALQDQGMLMLPMFQEWAASSPDLNVGAEGWICDELAMLADWGFDLGDIHKPCLLFTSEADQNVPASHSLWIADKVANSVILEVPNTQHDDLINPATIRTALQRLA